MADSLKQAKKLLRKEMASLLSKIPDEEVIKQTQVVTQKVINNNVYKDAKRISVYVNTAGEIKTDEIIRHALGEGKQVFIPWFAKGNPIMQMVELKEVEEFNELKPTLWDIRQFPTVENRKSYKEDGPLDLVLAPGVAFTSTGGRMGHGMAFYDKFFCEHKELYGQMPIKFALALNEQILDNVPIDDKSDVHIDQVIFAATNELEAN